MLRAKAQRLAESILLFEDIEVVKISCARGWL